MKQLLKYNEVISTFLTKEKDTLFILPEYVGVGKMKLLREEKIQPNDIVFRDVKREVREFILRQGLGRLSNLKAKVVFRYGGKDYLLIYNK